jgi:hypothetical protein
MIDPRKGRPDGRTHESGESVEETLESARRVFADVSRFLETEIDQLFRAEIDPEDEKRLSAVLDLIKQNQQALLKVLDMRHKLGRETETECRQFIDLEAARAEIDRRLARLAG